MEPFLPIETSSVWSDLTRAKSNPIWTVSDTGSTWIYIAVGVTLGLALASLQRLIAHALAGMGHLLSSRFSKSSTTTEVQRSETAPLLHSDVEAPTQTENHDRTRKYGTKLPRKSFMPEYPWGWAIYLAVAVGWTIAVALATNKSTNPDPALCGSKSCGAYGLTSDANDIAVDQDALRQGGKESVAGEYARDCYGDQSTISINQCSVFKEPFIASTMKTGQQCPFVNQTYCAGDGFTAVKFSTGIVDAKHLGLNVERGPLFRRSSICVPLNINAGFVTEAPDEDPGAYNYDLGSVHSDQFSSEYTFQQTSDPFDTDVRSYTMSTVVHTYGKDSSQNFWDPVKALDLLPELKKDAEPHSLTVMFINSCRIFYWESSSDPIFPAEKPFRHSELWCNKGGRARPLACIDWVEACTNENTCVRPDKSDQDHDKHFVFTRFALSKSTIFDAIFFRGAAALDAQRRINGDTSSRLDKNPSQWITESWNLFNASLARIQYDALDIAIGANREESTYEAKMPASFKDDMCGIFLIQLPKGYSNVHILLPILAGIVLPILLVILAHEIDHEFGPKWKGRKWFGHQKLMIIEWPWRKKLETETDPQQPEARTTGSGQEAAGGAANYGTTSGPQDSQIGLQAPASPAAASQQPQEPSPAAATSPQSQHSSPIPQSPPQAQDNTNRFVLSGSSTSATPSLDSQRPKPSPPGASAPASGQEPDQAPSTTPQTAPQRS